MGIKEDEQKRFFSEWLEKLQQESWQLELLISGFALFGIWEIKDWLFGLWDFVDANTQGPSETILMLFMNVLSIGWVIFFTNLLLHIILRGFWIGAIGLRYVSGEIEYDEFSYSETFTTYIKKKVGNFDDFIEKLEKISSVLFSYTFLLFFLFLSFLLLIIEMVVIIGILHYFLGEEGNELVFGIIAGFIGLIFVFFIFLIIIDVITLGGLRKIKEPTIAKMYLFFYKIFSVLTLSFFYRPILYNFLDNKYTRRLFLLGIPYGIIISLILPGFFLNSSSLYPVMGELHDEETILASRYAINPFYYDDLREREYEATGRKNEIYFVSLPSYEIEGDILSIFFRFRKRDEALFEIEKYSVSPYAHIGIRHDFFKKRLLRSDPIEDSLKLEKSKERLVMKKVIRGLELNEDEIDSQYIALYTDQPKEAIDSLADEINNRWSSNIQQRKETRLQEIVHGMESICQVWIDSTLLEPIKSFYKIHPNLKEKGVISYFRLDSLDVGPHEITIHRKTKPSRVRDELSVQKLYIPIVKN